MADARLRRLAGEWFLQLDASMSAGELYQLPDGRAAFLDSTTGASLGDWVRLRTEGQVDLTKTSGMVFLDGGRVYWDHSANASHYKKVNDRDFYVGRQVGDAASADTVSSVDLNIDPPYDIDLARDSYDTAWVGTQGLGTMGIFREGGSLLALLSSTSEAQKLDALSHDGFSRDAQAIVEFAFTVPSDGAGTVVDVSVGIANDTHATDADSITESLFMHLDANNTNINFESDDGTTEVAATDSTTDYTEGDTLSVRKEVWFDLRNNADIQVYVDGANVLPSTVFKLDAATGQLRSLFHIEKTSAADTYQFRLWWHRVRFAQQRG